MSDLTIKVNYFIMFTIDNCRLFFFCFADNVGGTLLQGLSCSTSKQSSIFSTFFPSTSITTTTTVTSTLSTTSSTCSSTSSSIPVTTVEQLHNALNESLSTTPPAPPKKRHCRSLSAGEVTEGRSRWKPNPSKIWRPFRQCRAKRDAYQGHSPMLNIGDFSNNVNFMESSALHSTTLNLAGDSTDPMMNQYSTPPESPIPRPASATSWENTTNPPVWLEHTAFKPLTSPRLWHRLRSLEDSEKEGLSASSGSVASLTSSIDSAPESDLTSSGGFARGTFKRAMVMPRCRSQPCVSNRKKCGKKRRREEESRPKLDLFKMREVCMTCPFLSRHISIIWF